MTELKRHPTHEEIEVILARARRMRSLYVAALVQHAALRAKQWMSIARERRGAARRRVYADVC